MQDREKADTDRQKHAGVDLSAAAVSERSGTQEGLRDRLGLHVAR